MDDIKSAKVIEKVKLDRYTLFKGMIPPSRTRFQKDDVARKQFGNAVPVPVVEYVAKELISILDI
ncbi:hypothetical protein [Nostoc sp.]|uniref:hypothetical protein n=1 Tax=Nostoc sp. TaxID=1180 RepID=UPI002FFA05CC